jgi:hypothetical protein
MRILHAIFCSLSKAQLRSKALFEASIALLASVAQSVMAPWSSGTACVARSLKDNYLRRLEAGTRSMEAEADKKAAEARLSSVRVAQAVRAVVSGTHEMNMHRHGRMDSSTRLSLKRGRVRKGKALSANNKI